MNDFPIAVKIALDSRDCEPTDVVAFDGAGTGKYDDFVAYKDLGAGRLIREVHVYDISAVVPPREYMHERAKKNFIDERVLFPSKVTKGFLSGDVLPTIKVSTEFDGSEVVSTKITESSVRLMDARSMFSLDKMFLKNRGSFLAAVKKDPRLTDVTSRSYAQDFAHELFRAILSQTNGVFLDYAIKNNLGLITRNNDECGFDSQLDENMKVKCTNPIRNWVSFVNLSIIRANLLGLEAPYSEAELKEFSAVEDDRFQEYRTGELNRESLIGAEYDRAATLESGYELFYSKSYAKLHEMLGENPMLGVDLITCIARRGTDKVDNSWQLATIRDLSLGRGEGNISQVVVMADGKQVRSKVVNSRGADRDETRRAGANSFWEQFFKEPDLSKWPPQKGIVDVKLGLELGNSHAEGVVASRSNAGSLAER